MADESDHQEAKRLGSALRRLRSRADMSQSTAAERFGIDSGEGWRKYESGRAKGIFQPGVQRRLAEALGFTLDDLLSEANLSPVASSSRLGGAEIIRPASFHARPADPGFIPLRDRVQAGAWLLADDMIQTVTPSPYPVGRDPRYPHADQWLSTVVGDSMNRLSINEGDLLHVVDAIAIGYYPKTRDIVEVERLRFDGSERELTVKEVEVTPDGPLLWPRSTNVRWQNPLDLREGAEKDETVEVRIRGLVLTSIRRFS